MGIAFFRILLIISNYLPQLERRGDNFLDTLLYVLRRAFLEFCKFSDHLSSKV